MNFYLENVEKKSDQSWTLFSDKSSINYVSEQILSFWIMNCQKYDV